MEQINPEKFVIKSEEALGAVKAEIKDINAEISMLNTTFEEETKQALIFGGKTRSQEIRLTSLEVQQQSIKERLNKLEEEKKFLLKLQEKLKYAMDVKNLWQDLDNLLHAEPSELSTKKTPEIKQKAADEIKTRFEELQKTESPPEDALKVLMRFEPLVNSL